MIITSLFRKLTKVSTNNFKLDINGIPNPLEMCKILFLHKSLFINRLNILSRVALEALHRFTLGSHTILPENDLMKYVFLDNKGRSLVLI